MKNILVYYSISTFGLLLVAAGVVLCIISNLGIGPLSVPAYALGGLLGLSIGNWVIIINTIFLLIQLLLLRKQFKAVYLLQLPANFIFGYLIDLTLFCLSWIHPESFPHRIILVIIACIITAFGVSIQVYAKGWMLSAEMTVYAIIQKIPAKFGNTKVVMDTSILITGCILSLFVNSNLLGRGLYEGFLPQLLGTAEGVVIGLGTLFMAILPGALMRLTDPIVKMLLEKTSSCYRTL